MEFKIDADEIRAISEIINAFMTHNYDIHSALAEIKAMGDTVDRISEKIDRYFLQFSVMLASKGYLTRDEIKMVLRCTDEDIDNAAREMGYTLPAGYYEEGK